MDKVGISSPAIGGVQVCELVEVGKSASTSHSPGGEWLKNTSYEYESGNFLFSRKDS